MVAVGWLVPVDDGGGARFWRDGKPVGKPAEYRINPRWIEGDDLSPSGQVTVTPETSDGDTAMSPEPSLEPSCTTPVVPDKVEQPVNPKAVEAVKALERSAKRSKPMLAIREWLELCKVQGVAAIPDGDSVWALAHQSGIPAELIELQWREFKARNIENGKRYRDWRQSFRNSVRDNWYRLWWMPRGEAQAQLTSQGLQAQARWAAVDAEEAREAGRAD